MNKLIIRIHLLLLIVSFSLADTSIAQINRIKIEGNKRLSNDDIIRISNIFPGMQITAAGEVQQGINRLWDLNRFNDIKIILDNEDSKIRTEIFGLPNIQYYCKNNNIVVTNTPNVLTDDVADLALGLMITLSRKIVSGHEYTYQKKWMIKPFNLSLIHI